MTAYRSFCASLLILAGAGIVSCGLLSNSNTNMAAPEVSSLSENSDEDLLGLYDNFRAKARKKIDANCGGKENVKKALDDLERVMAMANTGLYEAKVKCEAIAAARDYLEKTRKPKPLPFCSLRKNFKKALRKERNQISKANGGKSCKEIVKLNPTPTPTPMPTATVTPLATATPTVSPSVTPTVVPPVEPTVAPSAEPTVVQPPEPTPAPYNGDYPADLDVSETEPDDEE